MNQIATPDVLTLEEAAAYLRLPAETLARQAALGQIPGRRIEDAWRFLKTAIDDWLRLHDSRQRPPAGAPANNVETATRLIEQQRRNRIQIEPHLAREIGDSDEFGLFAE